MVTYGARLGVCTKPPSGPGWRARESLVVGALAERLGAARAAGLSAALVLSVPWLGTALRALAARRAARRDSAALVDETTAPTTAPAPVARTVSTDSYKLLSAEKRKLVEKKFKFAKKLGLDNIFPYREDAQTSEEACVHARTQDIDASFRKIDADGSGDIDLEELRTVFGDDAEELMEDLDTIQRDGKVQLDEWRKFFGAAYPVSGVSVARAAAKANTEAAKDIRARGASRTDAVIEDLRKF